MSRSRPIYFVFISFSASLTSFTVINQITSFKQMYLFFVHFLESLLLFLDYNANEEANDFQIAKVQFQGVASLLLNFLPVSALCCLAIKVLLIK